MSAKVSLNLGEENDIELTLDYKIKNGDINLSFHDDEGEDYITDKLSQFTSIDVDDNNPLKLILRGIKVDRPILFQKENEASDFWTAIQKIAKLSALPGPKRSFVITMEPQQPGIGDYVPLVNFLNRTITSTYQTVKNIVGGKELELPKQEEIIETDGFKLGYIQGSISDLRIVDFDENIEISKNHQISNTNFNEVQIFKIWQKLLLPNNSNTDKLLEDYKNIELQWKTLSKGQWNHSFQLRNFVVQTEKSIKESPVLSKDPFDSITFDLLLSLFAFHFSKLAFNAHFIQFLEILIPSCIKEVSPNGESLTYLTHNNEKLTREEICSRLFWMFKSFAEKFIIQSNQRQIPATAELYLSIKSQLSSISPSTSHMLEARKIKNLEFCEKDINSLFLRGRSLKDSQLMITAILSTSNVSQFISATLSTILVLLQSTLQNVPHDDKTTFTRLFETSLPNLDMRLILANEESLLGNRGITTTNNTDA